MYRDTSVGYIHPFFDSDLDIVSSCLFLVGTMYAVSSVSVSAATRLAYDMYGDTYYTYADLTFNFCLKYMILFQLLCV